LNEPRGHRGRRHCELVKLALKCDSAEQMGEQLKKRFEARQRYRGIDPGKGRERRAEAELERLLGQD
jgi:hypothetical protein